MKSVTSKKKGKTKIVIDLTTTTTGNTTVVIMTVTNTAGTMVTTNMATKMLATKPTTTTMGICNGNMELRREGRASGEVNAETGMLRR